MQPMQVQMLFVHFNSIKVRLKLCSTLRDQIELILFQFHKGTIKTKQVYRLYRKHLIFQFHKGTIKTASVRLLFLRDHHFNSIKVRLKHCSVAHARQLSYISIP